MSFKASYTAEYLVGLAKVKTDEMNKIGQEGAGNLLRMMADKIEWLRNQLDQLAEFNPSWDMLEATQRSLSEHQKELSDTVMEVDLLNARRHAYRKNVLEQKRNYEACITDLREECGALKREIKRLNAVDELRMFFDAMQVKLGI